MKKLTALILAALLTASVLASCGKDEPKDSSDTTPTDVDTQPNDETNPETTPAEEETKPAVDTSKMTDFAWSTATDTVVAALTFDGSNATFNVIENGVDKSVSGAYTATDDTLTIDGTELSWKVMASFCKITMGESTYSLSKSSDKDVAMGPYNLMKYTWSGDGATLSFADGKASIKIDGTDIDYNGTYTVNSADSIFIQDGAENSENLAIGATATASSVEAGVEMGKAYSNEFGIQVRDILLPVGKVSLALGEFIPAGTVFAFNFDAIRPIEQPVPGKGNFFLEPLAKKGAGEQYQLFGQVGLDYGNELLHGKITGLSTTFEAPKGRKVIAVTETTVAETPTTPSTK